MQEWTFGAWTIEHGYPTSGKPRIGMGLARLTQPYKSAYEVRIAQYHIRRQIFHPILMWDPIKQFVLAHNTPPVVLSLKDMMFIYLYWFVIPIIPNM